MDLAGGAQNGGALPVPVNAVALVWAGGGEDVPIDLLAELEGEREERTGCGWRLRSWCLEG